MAHPKRKISKTRRDKRRTHHKLTPKTLSTDQATGELHRSHRAHWHEGKLYYKGLVYIDKSDEIADIDVDIED
ncbi:MAG: 50S ribosomal protein L32 [Bernardetiaceae bacterium]|nr:50S ribosomal protein L32 [Bernardetiaceae bacterium]